VSEDDAFGIAGRAAGKDDRGDVIEVRRALGAHASTDPSRGNARRDRQGRDAFEKAWGCREILDVDDFRGRLDADLLEEETRADHRLEAALGGAGGQRLLRRRVVEVDGNLAHEERRRVDERSRHGRGEQDPDHRLVSPHLAQAACEKDGLGERREEREPGRFPVGHGEPARMAACGLNERARKRAHQAFPATECGDTERLNGDAGLARRRRRRHRTAEGHPDRIRELARPLPEEAAA